MAKRKAGPNDPCPCGSGKKRKKCCGTKGAQLGFSKADRVSAFRKMAFQRDAFDDECEAAFLALWGEWAESEDELPDDLAMMSEATENTWFYFDRPLGDGRLFVDVALEEVRLTAGERNFLTAARDTAMHLYEVEKAVPGVSLTLRDVLEGTRVTVNERTGSRTIPRHAWLAARVNTMGATGPEIEHVLPVPEFWKQQVRTQLTEMRDAFLEHRPLADIQGFYKELPPFFHDVWVSSILQPPIPELRNTDGEPMLWTRVSFDVKDVDRAVVALDAMETLERTEGLRWGWSRSNEKAEVVSLGSVAIEKAKLVLEANSAERAKRGREMLEIELGDAIRHLATTHEDLTRNLKNSLRDRALGRKEPLSGGDPAIAPEVAEALTLNYYARYYRSWLDESIPALDGATPREAAKDPRRQDALVDLLHQLEGSYQGALMLGEPAYDPSWMWAELGLDDEPDEAYPPPLAHERVAGLVPGSGDLSRSVAETARLRPSFSDKTTLLDPVDVDSHLDVRRFLKQLDPSRGEQDPATWKPDQLLPYLTCMINFDLHRRKAFWVDEDLTWQLANTDLDALGSELRVPFPSFALVFSDRRTLSLGERLLSKQPTNPLAGHFLEVTTVYITERSDGDVRTVSVCFAFDALGANLPQLVFHDLVISDETQIADLVATVGPPPVVADPPVEDASPLRGLLQVVINAILYATSAGVEPVVRKPSSQPPRKPSRRRVAPPETTSEEVYHLPGAIEISQLRRYQSLDRIPDGRAVLRRFMVRGHWRRASKNWKDQRMRWIEPYWKGPDLAAVIERTYKLKP